MGVRLSVLATVTVAVLLLAASAASASCENRAFITIGPKLPPGTVQPPGEASAGGTVAVHGYNFEPGSVSHLRLDPTGSVLAQATADVDGSWVASFQLDRQVAEGVHIVYADALHLSGEMVTPSRELTVRGGTAPPGEQQPQGTEGGRQAIESGPALTTRDPEPRAESTPPAARTAAPPAAQDPQPAAQAETPATRADAPATQTPVRERARGRTDEASPAYRLEGPADDKTRARASPSTVAPRTQFAERSGDDQTILLIAVGAVLLVMAGGGYALARRRPPHAAVPVEVVPPPGPEPSATVVAQPVQPDSAPDRVEAELQEIIAEERARERDRPLSPVG